MKGSGVSSVRRSRARFPAAAGLVMLAVCAMALPLGLGSAVTGQVVASVDIGNLDSEAACQLEDWGDPVICTGSGWGGLVGDCRVVWQPTTVPDESQSWATVTIPISEDYSGSIHVISMDVLDGQADDSFEVFVMDPRDGSWVSVYSYPCDPSTTEVWVTHDIELPMLDDECPVPHGAMAFSESGYTIKIVATGDPAAWAGFSTYGMLAVDEIRLVGDGKAI